jgi:hypothetical protein
MSELVTRETLNDWICNDGLDHLLEEGYLSYEQVDPDDAPLRSAVANAQRDRETMAQAEAALPAGLKGKRLG